MKNKEYMELGKTYELGSRKIELSNGNNINVDISVKLEFDEYFDLNDFDHDERKELAEKLERGDLTATNICVRASFLGVDEEEYLCGVLLEGPITVAELAGDWIKHNQMIEEAVDSLKERLNEFFRSLQS